MRVVKLLLANDGVSVDARDKEGKTPLMLAANGGAEATCVFLVEHAGASITAVDDSGATAAVKESTEKLKILIVSVGQ